MRVNRLRDHLVAGKTVFGCQMQAYRSPEIARTFAAAGFDFVFIDMEHGTFTLETMQDIAVAAVGAGITPTVRVDELLYSLVARAMGNHGGVSARLRASDVAGHAKTSTDFNLLSSQAFTLRNWPVSWRLFAVIMLTLAMGLVFGGLDRKSV